MASETNLRVPDDVSIPSDSFWQKLPILGLIAGLTCIAYWATAYQADAERAMYGYLFGFISVLSLALGCLFFVIIQHLTRAGWSVVVRRVAEFGAATMPLLALLFLPIAFFAHDLFPWGHVEAGDAVIEAKAPYLNMPFFMMRSVGYFVIWIGLSVWLLRSSISQDDGKNPQESKRQWTVSAPGIILFALTLTFASIDWVMSLQPHWYSTIFGVYFFAGCFLSGLAFMTLTLMGLQKSGALARSVTAEHYHDLGKLMFGFTVFWAYSAFSQFMLYWYANIPEEVEFFYHRLDHGWEWISFAIPLTNFFIPFFFIMSRHMKRNKVALAIFCIWTLLFHFVDLFWLMLPNYGAHGGEELPHAAVHLHDIAALVGMLCLFMAVVSFLAIRQKVAPAGDPRWKESLAFENF